MVYSITVPEVNKPTDRLTNIFFWKPFALSVVLCLSFFTHGIETFALTTSAHSGHFRAQSDGVPWSTTALLLSALASAPLYCYCADRLGRVACVYVTSLLQGASLIPLFLPPSEPGSIVLHVLAGLSSGGLFTVFPTYIAELSLRAQQALNMSLMTIAASAGYTMQLMVEEEVLLYLMVGMVALQLLLMFSLIESPSYLVMVGKIERAASNVSHLISRQASDRVVKEIVDNLQNESERARAKGTHPFYRILKDQIWRSAFKLGLSFHTALVFGGSMVFLSPRALEQLPVAEQPHHGIYTGCMLAGSLLFMMLVGAVDVKYILTVFFTLMVLSCGVLAVYCQTDRIVTSHHIVPITALTLLIISYGVIWGAPVIAVTQMFNFEIRATLLGLLYAYSQIMKLVHVHTFKYVEELMGMDGVLYVFAFVNLFGGVYALFAMPNTRGRSLREIERQMKKIPILK